MIRTQLIKGGSLIYQYYQYNLSDNKISLKDKELFIPLIVTAFLVSPSFIPLLQVVLLEVSKQYKPLSSASHGKV